MVPEPLPDQRPARVRLEWGLTGARALLGADGSACLVVVVDVLSFSTAVTVACERGTVVHPYPYRDPAGASALAARLGATLAGPRGDGRVSLSPSTLRHLRGGRLVLPSPNGATIAHGLAGTGAVVVVGCVRNASAVAQVVDEHLAADATHDVVLVPAGERWADGSLRPCLEDHLGAGAIAAAIPRVGDLSTEARAAALLWQATPDPAATIRDTTSGRELVAAGWPQDVEIAAEHDATESVARLTDDGLGPAFTGNGP
ncbi:2-phosphosulfolactate phosphatase [Cellulomonas sp. zg-ZUI188]|uniref:Probable 2-phosphosulfolactate phosphatase n=1 Tax=Cellulomonas fengjieae TaxID=2819978 RepID=A0ABS3SJS1_9CELL|nr:2-phosphosulfolactate phosphatase [Cellulomonas fengjieae]QVI68056.1 2-phosphosulfolactate phosphatase [Cellulomonas fengjieae]